MTALVLTEGRPQVSDETQLVEWAASAGQEIAVDTETTGFGWGATTRLVQLGDDRGAFSVDVTTEDGRSLVRSVLMEYYGSLVFHNAGFDIHALRDCVEPEYLWPRACDTYVMAQTVASEANNGLDDLTARILGADNSWKKDFRKNMRKRKWTWETVPRLMLSPYGLQDVRNTWLLWDWFLHNASANEWRGYHREMEAAQAMFEVQQHGLLLDMEYAQSLRNRWEFDIETYRSKFLARWGIENPNSNRQIAASLVESGWVPKEYTPTREPKLDKAVLTDLAHDYEQAALLLKLKRLVKWKAAYVDNCVEQADSEGYVHARYNSLGTITRRMSCSEPPLQQLPKGGGGEIRRLFIASPGNVIASVDYSAIELRLAGHLSGEQAIVDAFNEGRDLYQDLANSMETTRDIAKVVILASLYGWSGRTDKAGLGLPEHERRDLIGRFWDTYPALSAYAYNCSRKSEVHTALWGHHIAPRSRHAGVNAVIQGTAAEVMKEGLLRLASAGLLRYVAAVVHDEVVLDLPEGGAEELLGRVAERLTDVRFNPVLVAEGQVYGPSWGSGYE